MGWGLNLAYASALTVVSPWLAWRAARTGRYREGWPQRLFGSVPEQPPGRSTIWVHGVSLGEVQLLGPLIKRLAQEQPQYQVVLSTSTRTGMQLARMSLPEIPSFYCPWDFTWAVRRALSRLSPRLIVLGELELWPHLIGIAAQSGIPVAVVNGRLSDRSLQGYQRFHALLGRTFKQLALVAAQDVTTAERFRHLGVEPARVHATGSLKFDNVNADRGHAEVLRRAALVGLTAEHRVLVAGSTQDPEEQAVARAYQQSLAKHPLLKLIVVPRHPERFDSVERVLTQTGLTVVRRSALRENLSAADWQVLLVDTVGELKWWWGLAELAVVGGTFGDRGGQNMLEPAAYGAKVAFGPNTWNFRAIVRALLDNQAAWELPSLDALPGWIDDQLSQPEAGNERCERAVKWIASHQGATERTYTLLEQLLKT